MPDEKTIYVAETAAGDLHFVIDGKRVGSLRKKDLPGGLDALGGALRRAVRFLAGFGPNVRRVDLAPLLSDLARDGADPDLDEGELLDAFLRDRPGAFAGYAAKHPA